MKKVFASTLFVIATFIAITSSATTNWKHGFARGGYNRGVETRGYYNGYNRGAYSHYYNRGYYYNQPHFAYNVAPVVAYNNYQYGPRRMGYYFYPSANVYFNPYNHLYVYPSRGVWVTAAVLPREFAISEPYRQVYCGVGENIWAYNRLHINIYRRAPVYATRGYRGQRFH